MGIRGAIIDRLIRGLGVGRVYRRAWTLSRAALSAQIISSTGLIVQNGPFRGMILPAGASWGDGDLGPKLLGTYESELHRYIEEALAVEPLTVVNVGCAEGYYAVGTALRLSSASVFAFDVDRKALAVCRSAVEANGVERQVFLRERCSHEELQELCARPGGVLLIIDCEGEEVDLLDFELVPDLARCHVLVETHDFVRRGITDILHRRLSCSHVVHRVDQGGRDPHITPATWQWPEYARWLMVDENRPERMSWLVGTPQM